MLVNQISSVDRLIKRYGTNNILASFNSGNLKNSLEDFGGLIGTKKMDFRGNYRNLKMKSFGSRFASATNMFSYGISIELRVLDVIQEYQLSPGTLFTDQEKTFAVVENKADNNAFLNFGFYHKLTSNHEHVGGTSGNSHVSEFFFKVYDSGPVCSSGPITSLDSDLGLRWVYLHFSRDIWSNTIHGVFKNNLMAAECTHDFDAVNGEKPYATKMLIGNEGGSLNSQQPSIFFYDYLSITENMGGKIYTAGDPKRKRVLSNQKLTANLTGRL